MVKIPRFTYIVLDASDVGGGTRERCARRVVNPRLNSSSVVLWHFDSDGVNSFSSLIKITNRNNKYIKHKNRIIFFVGSTGLRLLTVTTSCANSRHVISSPQTERSVAITSRTGQIHHATARCRPLCGLAAPYSSRENQKKTTIKYVSSEFKFLKIISNNY